MTEWLASVAQPWADWYGASTPVQTLVLFLHLGGLLVAGGVAFASDRAVLRAWRAGPERQRHVLVELGDAHRVVLGGLAVVIASGLLMLLADLESLLGSWVFWAKMAGFVVLLVNGLVLRSRESAARTQESAEWRPLRTAAVRSAGLWLMVLLLGSLLPAAV